MPKQQTRAPRPEDDLAAVTVEAVAAAQCRRSPLRFLKDHVRVYDASARQWLPFDLWPAQVETLHVLEHQRQVVILKARQLGFTWLTLGWCLWNMLMRPAATILLFSQREDEAMELLHRLKGMHERLSPWLQGRHVSSDKHQWALDNGSRALAFSTSSGGRSHTASIALVDEADYVPDLGRLLDGVRPTIDAGGQLLLLSTSNKGQPDSDFKRLYRAARTGQTSYTPIFYGWSARPGRDEAWYAQQRRDREAQDGTPDALYEEYPATDAEALAPRSLDKRFPAEWLQGCFTDTPSLARVHPEAPQLPGLVIYREPVPGSRYVLGVDPAEGNPTSDDSAIEVLDAVTGEQVACLAGKFQPDILAAAADQLGRWYNHGGILCERNNHGHAVLMWLGGQNSPLPRLAGPDCKPGWLNNVQNKTQLFDECAKALREKRAQIHHPITLNQLQSIEGTSLRAPTGQHDDRAVAFALAVQACRGGVRLSGAPFVGVPGPVLPRSPFWLNSLGWRR